MIYVAFSCAAFMIISELLSILISSSHSNLFYDFIGLDIKYIHYKCMKLATSFDINKCYIDSAMIVTYFTRWPYVISYTTLITLSFYNILSCVLCVILSFGFCMYNFYNFGENTVAAWINLFVCLLCANRIRNVLLGRF